MLVGVLGGVHGRLLGPFNRFLGNTDLQARRGNHSSVLPPGTNQRVDAPAAFVCAFVFGVQFRCFVGVPLRFDILLHPRAWRDKLCHRLGHQLHRARSHCVFMKQKVNRQTFNTACSLASISLATCIVKEGSLNSQVIPMGRLLSTAHVVVVGSLIPVAICYLVWPKSAVTALRTSLNDSFNIMSSLLSITTHRF